MPPKNSSSSAPARTPVASVSSITQIPTPSKKRAPVVSLKQLAPSHDKKRATSSSSPSSSLSLSSLSSINSTNNGTMQHGVFVGSGVSESHQLLTLLQHDIPWLNDWPRPLVMMVIQYAVTKRPLLLHHGCDVQWDLANTPDMDDPRYTAQTQIIAMSTPLQNASGASSWITDIPVLYCHTRIDMPPWCFIDQSRR